MENLQDYIQIRNLKFSYAENEENKEYVLDGIDLSIKKGEFVAIVGRNGSGKSTLALCLNALLIPSEGNVVVDGLDTSVDENVWEIRKRVGMVFQNPDNQLVSSIIEDDVAFGPENIGIDPAEIRRRVDDALAAVNMSEYAKKSPHLLSGGQKQRVAIAGVIAMRTDTIVIDESTAMLDPQGRAGIMEIINRLHDEGHTIIMITHFMEEAAFADRMIVLSHGRIAMQGSPAEIFSKREEIAELDLETPQVIKLIEELEKKGVSVPEDITTEKALTDYLCALK